MDELGDTLGKQVQNYELKFDHGGSGMLVIQHSEHGVVNFTFTVDGDSFVLDDGADSIELFREFVEQHPAIKGGNVVAG